MKTKKQQTPILKHPRRQRRLLGRKKIRELDKKYEVGWAAPETCHEAGHAIVHIVCGHKVACLEFQEDDHGWVVPAIVRVRQDDAGIVWVETEIHELVDEVAACLGGYLAQRFHNGEWIREDTVAAATTDMKRVRDLLARLPAPQRFGMMLRAARKAYWILYRHRDALHALAAQLSKKEYLDEGDFGPILHDYRVRLGKCRLTNAVCMGRPPAGWRAPRAA